MYQNDKSGNCFALNIMAQSGSDRLDTVCPKA